MRMGRNSDEFFLRFTAVKEEGDIEAAKDLLSDLDSLSDEDRNGLSELYMDIENYINDREYDLEY